MISFGFNADGAVCRYVITNSLEHAAQFYRIEIEP